MVRGRDKTIRATPYYFVISGTKHRHGNREPPLSTCVTPQPGISLLIQFTFLFLLPSAPICLEGPRTDPSVRWALLIHALPLHCAPLAFAQSLAQPTACCKAWHTGLYQQSTPDQATKWDGYGDIKNKLIPGKGNVSANPPTSLPANETATWWIQLPPLLCAIGSADNSINTWQCPLSCSLCESRCVVYFLQ